MSKVSFDWADGPNSGNEHHFLSVFTPDGERIRDFEKQEIAYHKKGSWSYSELIVSVAEGNFIYQFDSSTHSGSERHKIWRAVAGRPVIWTASGKWSQMPTFPQAPEGVSEEIWHKMLHHLVKIEIVEKWEANKDVKAI